MTAEQWLYFIVPVVTRVGEKALADLGTPAKTYDLMLACDGKKNLWRIIQEIDYPVRTAADGCAIGFSNEWLDFRLSHATSAQRFLMGEFLVALKLVTPAQIEQALKGSQKLGEQLVHMKALTHEQLKFALRVQTLFRLGTRS